MLKRIVFIFFCVIFSCKNESNKPLSLSSIQSYKEKSIDLLNEYALKVEINFDTDSKGLYQIKFRGPDKIKKPKISYLNVVDTTKTQLLQGVYNLDDNDFPEYIQLIMSSNESQKIKINYIKLVTDEVIINIDKNNFKNFLQTSSYTFFNSSTGYLTTKSLNNKFVPVVFLNRKTLDSLSFMEYSTRQ